VSPDAEDTVMRSSRYAVRAYAPRSALTRMGASSAAAAVTVAGLVLGLGLPSATAAPGGRQAVATVTGTVERIHLDDFAHPVTEGSDEVTFVRTADGSLQVPADDLAQVPTGARVRLGLADTRGARPGATGALVSSLTAAQERDPQSGPTVASVEVLSTVQAGEVSTGTGVAATDTAVAAGTALHSVLVVVVRPPGGATTSVTATQIASTISTGVNSYWSTVTGGAVGFTATAYSKVVSTTSAPCSAGSVSGSGTFWSEVQSRTGWTSGSGRHLVVYFPAYAACGGIAGLGTVGQGVASGGVVWSNGYGTGSQGIGVIGHELGHNLGLGHSQLLDCSVSGVRVMDTDPANCSSRSYADTNDIMAVSWNYQGFLNAVHLRSLGLLGASDQTVAMASGQVTLRPIETASGMRVLTLTSGATHYVVEYRQPIGRDSWMATYPGWGSAGVTVRKEFDPTQPTGFRSIESYLLDGDPSTSDAGYGTMSNTLPVGSWISLDGGTLGVHVVSLSATGAEIEYTTGDPTLDPRYVAPIVPTLSTPGASLTRGAMKPTKYGPAVPVVWRWTVATPSTDPAEAASVVGHRAILPSVRMASAGWFATAYRAVALASDNTQVSSVGRALTHYRTERSTAIAYSRGWTTSAWSAAVGGSLRTTVRKGGALAFRVTGRSIGILLAHGPAYGSVAVYLDGTRVAILKQHTSRYGVMLAFAKTFAEKGLHTVRLVNLTGGRSGRLGFDGVASVI
jgi:hypothetical protein